MKVRKIKIKDHIVTYAAEENGCWVLANGETVNEEDIKIIDVASDEMEDLFTDVLRNFEEKEKIENALSELKLKNNENDKKLKEMLHIINGTEFIDTFLKNLSPGAKTIMKCFVVSEDLNEKELPIIKLQRRSLVEPVDFINQFFGDDFEFEAKLITKYSFFIESPYISKFGNYIDIDQEQRGWYINEYYDFDISCMTADEAIKLAHSIINY